MTNTNNAPKISVLMPVYNGEKFLKDSINSILNQTFTDFEFLIINDGSTDNTVNIIKSFNDYRIKIIHNKRNLGLVKSLNKGIKIAKGKYIARMDCDDISLKQRLESQIKYLDNNNNVYICGTWVKTFGEKEEVWKYPVDSVIIKSSLFFESVLVHSSVMIRASLFADFNLFYDEKYPYAEDYELWVRASKYVEFANIPKVLHQYNISKESTSRKHNEIQKYSLLKIYKINVSELGLVLSNEDLELFYNLSKSKDLKGKCFIEKSEQLLEKILLLNNKQKRFPKIFFYIIIGKKWLQIIKKNISFCLIFYFFFKCRITKYCILSLLNRIWFSIKYGFRYD